MTTARQLSEILDTLEVMANLNVSVTTSENSIYVVSDGRIISKAFGTSEELIGWVSCYKDFKEGLHNPHN